MLINFIILSTPLSKYVSNPKRDIPFLIKYVRQLSVVVFILVVQALQVTHAQQLQFQKVGESFESVFPFMRLYKSKVVTQTTDGGFLAISDWVEPYTFSKFWLFKLDQSCNVMWHREYDLYPLDHVIDIIETTDGGILLAKTKAVDSTNISQPNMDFELMKLNSIGDILWTQHYGGSNDESIRKIIEIRETGEILIGGSSWYSTINQGNKEHQGRGMTDYWLVKVDAQGNKLWDRIYGGTRNDTFSDMTLTNDGDIILVGNSNSDTSYEKSDNNLGGSRGSIWTVKVDMDGNQLWDTTLLPYTYDSTIYQNVAPINILVMNEKVYIGSAWYDGSNKGGLICLDNNGDFLWQNDFGDNNALISMTASDENEILVLRYGSQQYRDIKVDMYTENGDQKFSREIQPDYTLYDQQFEAVNSEPVLVAHGNDIVMAGTDKVFILGTVEIPSVENLTSWFTILEWKTEFASIDIRDRILVCKKCLYPPFIRLEDIAYLDYRVWPVTTSVRNAEYHSMKAGNFTVRGEELRVPLTKDLTQGEYKVQIRAYYGDGQETDWTEPVNYKVEKRQESKEVLSVYPNPFEKEINLVYQSPAEEDIVIEITNYKPVELALEERVKTVSKTNQFYSNGGVLLKEGMESNRARIDLSDSNQLVLKERISVRRGENNLTLFIPPSNSDELILKIYARSQAPVVKRLKRKR